MFPSLGIGLGLRPVHYSEILEASPPQIDWFEATTENYLSTAGGKGGRPLQVLEAIRRDYPIVLHGVSLSLGSVDPLDSAYLKEWKALIERVEPAWVSDHLCWTGVGGENLHDLLPLPYTEEALTHLTDRIRRVQDFLGRRILVENVSSYVAFNHSTLTEWEFLAELTRRADCGLLLDVNNVFVSSVNHGFDPEHYFEALPAERVGQIHLAGHSEQNGLLVDTHDHAVADPVWNLFRSALTRFGRVTSMIEWDAKIPDFAKLTAEANRAKLIQSEVFKDEAHPSVAL